MEGMQKRFVIRKHKNGDGMILCNRLATSKKGGVCGWLLPSRDIAEISLF